MTKSLTNLRIDSQLSMKEAIERTRLENEGKTIYTICGRTLNQDRTKGKVVIAALLCKYFSKEEAISMIPKYQTAFGNEWVFWIL